jgi:thiamine biosynthesis lipoprotein
VRDARAVERTTFRAMGTTVEVVAVGGRPEVLDVARGRIEHLERRWSRFLPDSDISRLNAANGAPVILTAVTFDLITLAVAWSQASEGTFDPTVIDALEAAGYDRTFDAIDREAASPAARPAVRTPGIDGIELDPRLRAVRLPRGVRLDLGGIGKGRAADLVAEELAPSVGPEGGLCVNLGGDLRAVGVGPDGGWGVTVDDPFGTGNALGVIGFSTGGVATSATTARAWSVDGSRRHHLIDPATGESSTGIDGSVTVIAPTAVEAEVRAKVAVIEGETEVGRLAAHRIPALVVDASGQRLVGGMEAFLR